MRVRQLQTYLQDNGMIGQTPLESLRGLRVGFDAVYWLRSMHMLKDPYADPLGGCPPGMFPVIARELEQLTKLNIHPVFVFDGMVPPLQHQLFNTTNSGSAACAAAWSAVVEGREPDAQKEFAICTSRINNDLCHYVFHYLKSHGYDCMRAPYFAGSQLSAMASSKQLQAVFGPPGHLMYGIRRLIIAIEPKGAAYVDLEHILTTFSINKEQFIDACLLAGTEFCLTFPFLNVDPVHGGFTFGSAIELARAASVNHYLGSLTEELRSCHVEGLCITKTLALYSPVFRDGAIEPMTRGSPEDMNKLIGSSLPSAVYGLLEMGLISHRIPQAISTGEWIDRQGPFVDSEEYRALLVDLSDYRRKALGLVSEACPGLIPKGKKLMMKTYWESQAGRNLTIKSGCKLNWSRLTRDEVAAELKRQGVDSPDVRFCLRWHSHDLEMGGAVTRVLYGEETGESKKQSEQDSNWLLCQTLFSFLEAIDMFGEEGSTTVMGDVLKDASPVFQEQILLAVELLKFGLLNGDVFEAPTDRPFPPAVNYPSSASNVSVTLVSRVMSLLPMRLKCELWDGKLDFDLAAYHCAVRSLNRALRSVVEGALSNVILKDLRLIKAVPNHIFSPSGALPAEVLEGQPSSGPESALPSFLLPRACLGLVCKFFLEFDAHGPDAAKSFEAELRKRFRCCVDPLKDLKVGVKFWKETMRCVSGIAEGLSSPEILHAFTVADSLLDQKRRLLGV